MMQDQLERSKAETEGILNMKEKVEGILEGLGQAKLAEIDLPEDEIMEEPEEEAGKVVWDELEKEFS